LRIVGANACEAELRESLNEVHATFGYDAQNGEFGNLFTKGIIDPAKVLRTALQDAASIAGLMITTEAMVAEKPKPKGSAQGNAGMGEMEF
jgi:chaperonin GroEL